MIQSAKLLPQIQKRSSQVHNTQISSGSRMQVNSKYNSLIMKIQNRKNKNISQVQPQQALNITKRYLLNQLEKNARNQFSSPKGLRNLDFAPKLSEILKQKIEKIRNRTEILKEKLKSVNKSKSMKEMQVYYIKAKLQEVETYLNFSKQQKMTFDPSTNLSGSFQILQQKLEEKSFQKKKIAQIYKQNSKFNTNQVVLKHQHFLLSFHNLILGQRLKGLFSSSMLINQQSSLQNPLSNMTFSFFQQAQQAFNMNTNKMNTVNLFLTLNQTIVFVNSENSQIRKKMFFQIRKIKNASYQKINRLQGSILKTQLQNAKKKGQIQNLTSKLLQLQSFYSKSLEALTTLKQKKKKRKRQDEEVVCAKCRQLFSESLNHDKACEFHPSEWNGSMYWCCGNNKIENPGCTKSKHSKTQKKEYLSTKPRLFCTSCKRQGHSHFVCPQDPNTRTKANPQDELVRIQRLPYNKMRKTMITEAPLGSEMWEKSVQSQSDHWKEVQSLRSAFTFKVFDREEIQLQRPKTLYPGNLDPLFFVPKSLNFSNKKSNFY